MKIHQYCSNIYGFTNAVFNVQSICEGGVVKEEWGQENWKKNK